MSEENRYLLYSHYSANVLNDAKTLMSISEVYYENLPTNANNFSICIAKFISILVYLSIN
jgi:hypothetical protein